MTAQLPETALTEMSQLYERDYFSWLKEIARILRSGNLENLDAANLAEEIEDMGRSEKRAVESNLEILLMHLLKYKFQPQMRSNSWRFTILEHRKRLGKIFKDSPSLRNYCAEVFNDCYEEARQMAATETGLPIDLFPAVLPFTVEESLDPDYLPSVYSNDGHS